MEIPAEIPFDWAFAFAVMAVCIGVAGFIGFVLFSVWWIGFCLDIADHYSRIAAALLGIASFVLVASAIAGLVGGVLR